MERTQILTLIWVFIQVCMLAFVISAWAAAGSLYDPPVKPTFNANGEPGVCDGNLLCQCTVNHSAAFGLVWQTLLAVMLSIYGTVVLKRNRTPLAIGCFIGITIMMANWTFTTAVQEGARILDKTEGGILYQQCAEQISASGDKAVVVFAVFLFLFYTAFGVLLTMWRDEILGIDPPTDDKDFEDDDVNAVSSV